MKRTIPVRLKENIDRSYQIHIGDGVFARIPGQVRASGADGVFVITDSKVARSHGRAMQRDLTRHGIPATMLDVPPGEKSKNNEMIWALQTELLRHGINRGSLIIAVGGGVVGDITGFVAATVLRGVRYVHIPTTLLAQVDSSVGGKVGIDHPLGKNLIGAFHQPSAVFVDPALLGTLPEKEFRNGLAEIVKIAAALDARFFHFLERRADRLTKKNTALLKEVIAESIALKAAVVMRDERESGLRKVLNLGHTIGHALEAALKYRIPHGSAVAMGLAAEAKLAVDMGIMRKNHRERLVRLLRKLGLPVRIPREANNPRFYSALAVDKKSDERGTQFVLLKEIGHCIVGVHIPTPMIATLFGRTK